MDCHIETELGLDEWSETLKSQLQGKRYPFGGVFEITDRCNLGCVHCYINQAAGNKSVKESELTTIQVKRILDEMVENGCLYLLLTGGEILLRPDFEEIYRHAKKCGFIINLFTNGTLINPQIADLFSELKPHSIEITLYGATRETYEKVTGVPGSYDRCMRGIDLLLERNLPLLLKSVLISINYHELEDMKTLAEKLGVKYRYDGLLWPRMDGKKDPLNYQIPLQQLIDLDTQNPERLDEWRRVAERSNGHTVRNEYLYSCGAGLRSFHIDSHGLMSICTMSRRYSYDLNQMSFRDAWDKLGELRKLKRQKETPCQTCSAGAFCVQCPGWSQAVHQDDETPVEFICALGHQRAKQFGNNHI